MPNLWQFLVFDKSGGRLNREGGLFEILLRGEGLIREGSLIEREVYKRGVLIYKIK